MKIKKQIDNENLPIYMKPKDWKKSYKTGLPHWAVDFKPSRLAVKFLKYIGGEGNKILEIGVGNGRDSIYFAKEGNSVFGIDIAKGAIKLAEENKKNSGVGRIVFSVGNAENLKFNNSFFDGVYSISVLHSTNLEKSFAEISRVLKPKGKVIIYLYEFTIKNRKKYWFYKKEEIIKMLKKNKFLIHSCCGIWDTAHGNEKTKILIFQLKKLLGEIQI